MLCVKITDCGQNTIFENRLHLVYSFRECIAYGNLVRRRKVKKLIHVSILQSL